MAVYGVECCPYLGAHGDLSSYNPYPVDEAICLVAPKPRGVSVKHQGDFCLVASYHLCPHLTGPDRLGGKSAIVTSSVPMWVTAGVIFITVGLAWAVLGLIDRNGREIPGRAVEVSDTEWEQVTRSAQSNLQVGSSPKDSVTANITPTTVVQAPAPDATSTPPPVQSTAAPSPVQSTAVPSPVVSSALSTKVHEVQPGETLSGIGRLYGVTVDALRASNGLGRDDILRSGTRLVVSISGSVYVVQAGDTLTGIAQKDGISLDELTAANGISRSSPILAGQQLVIPQR